VQLQLEWHYSKNEILELYMNYAPMGGVLEGVEAASRGYLGKPSSRLTPAESRAAHGSPSVAIPVPAGPFLKKRAQAARNKVLRRMKGH
jgi:penicillin-binding protein 1C